MSAVSSQVRDAGAILPAVDAITNTKALAVEFVAMAVGVALFGLFASMGMSSMSFSAFGLAFLLFLICAGTGFNAAGVVLMDEASGASSRSFTDALLAGLFALGKAIVVMILAGLAFLGIVLAVALLLWICKIPVVGPVLFFIVFPLSAVTIGVLFVAFAFVLAPIASPAIWSGESIGTALARVAMVIRKRLVGVVVRACVLFVLLIVTAMVLWWIALSGTLTAGSLSLGIVGVDTNLTSLTSMFGGGFDSGYGRSYGGYGRTPRGMPMPGMQVRREQRRLWRCDAGGHRLDHGSSGYAAVAGAEERLVPDLSADGEGSRCQRGRSRDAGKTGASARASAGRARARSAAEPGDASRCRRRRWIKQSARCMIEVRS